LALVKKHIVGNGICHLLNGQIVRSSNIHNQSLWHRDFNKTHISKPIMSFNTLFMLGEYSDINNFNTLQDKHRFSIIPFSQKLYGKPDENLLKKEEIITCEPGSLLVFNSQLWHKVLVSGLDQMFLNIMFTEPFIKQQINLLGASEDWINKYSSTESELARLLGWWSRSPKDLKEFRSPPLDIRTYRSGQG
jgi:ectoine hydroxylase-related dioxygenase (phytanoyl-CoA dioxygenase family)